jgi:DHA1 family tetracycline resistance protein-like MFS transporter
MAKTGLNTQRVLPIFVLVFVDVLGLTVILPLLHLYGAAYGASPLEIGLIAAAFPLAQLIGVPVMGMLSDRFGRKPLLLISQITTCISFIMLGFANSLAMVIFSRLFDGLFGANIATAQAALSDVTDESNRSAGLGLTGAAFGLGFIFGPLISLLALEATDSLAVPALSAAIYSAISILLTLFLFEETLPPEKRQQQSDDNKAHQSRLSPVIIWGYLRQPQIGFLLVLMFAQQVIFFGFESLMGLFTLSRLGILGQGNAILFLIIGTVLVIVQVRFIGRWTQRWGEMRVAQVALGLLASGLILVALTPQQPQPFYVQARVQYELAQQAPSSTEAILGDLGVELPAEGNNGIIGIVWMAVMIVPLSVGAGLIRPALNSLMTKQVSQREYGAILGVSAAFVSAANATAPIVGGLLFQRAGTTTPFLLGGIMMALLWSISLLHLRRSSQA